MRSLIAIFLVLVCFMDKCEGTFTTFMTNLPTEIAKVFGTAFGSLRDAVHKPYRVTRLGKMRTLKKPTTHQPVKVERRKEELETTSVEMPETTTLSASKLKIPHLKPTFTVIGDRRYALTIDGERVDTANAESADMEVKRAKGKQCFLMCVEKRPDY